jgi:hypothetical protein
MSSDERISEEAVLALDSITLSDESRAPSLVSTLPVLQALSNMQSTLDTIDSGISGVGNHVNQLGGMSGGNLSVLVHIINLLITNPVWTEWDDDDLDILHNLVDKYVNHSTLSTSSLPFPFTPLQHALYLPPTGAYH